MRVTPMRACGASCDNSGLTHCAAIMGLSDDESSGSEIPYKDPATKTTKDSSESSDESDSGEEEDEYVVEAIREHAFKNVC